MKSINNPSCHILKIIQQVEKVNCIKNLWMEDAKKVNLLLNDIHIKKY